MESLFIQMTYKYQLNKMTLKTGFVVQGHIWKHMLWVLEQSLIDLHDIKQSQRVTKTTELVS